MNLNEQVEEATIRPDILHFFGQFIFIRESWKWMPVATMCKCFFMQQWNNRLIFFLTYSTQYPTIRHTVLRQVTWFVD